MSSRMKRLRWRTPASFGRSVASDSRNTSATFSADPGLILATMTPRLTILAPPIGSGVVLSCITVRGGCATVRGPGDDELAPRTGQDRLQRLAISRAVTGGTRLDLPAQPDESAPRAHLDVGVEAVLRQPLDGIGPAHGPRHLPPQRVLDLARRAHVITGHVRHHGEPGIAEGVALELGR